MRVTRSGSFVRISANRQDIEDFMDQWPASGLGGLKQLTAEFDRNGNLVDLTSNKTANIERFDGPALAALVEDMQKYAEEMLD